MQRTVTSHIVLDVTQTADLVFAIAVSTAYVPASESLTATLDGAPVAFRELCALPLVAPDREHDLRQLMERTALAQNCALNVLYEINQAELSRSLVYGGLAFAVLPRNAFAARDEASVAARDIVEPRLSRIQSLAWSLDQPLTAAGKLVREVVLELVAAMVTDGRLKGRLLAAGALPRMGVEA